VKQIILIAGPNGAGKTTFAQEFLPNEATCFEFINADLIAQKPSQENSPQRTERSEFADGAEAALKRASAKAIARARAAGLDPVVAKNDAGTTEPSSSV
jgi:predicted ABC-type ATPase